LSCFYGHSENYEIKCIKRISINLTTNFRMPVAILTAASSPAGVSITNKGQVLSYGVKNNLV
jgi:hypothetical protein